MTETALVIINMQNARTSKNSEYYLGNLSETIKKINYLIEYARTMEYKIIFVQHLEEEGPFSPENSLSNIIPELNLNDTIDTIIQKDKISAYYQTTMEEELKDIKNLVVCWALTNLCVRMFVEESYDRGFRIALIEDLTMTFNQDVQEMTLEDLYNTRSGLNILSLEKFIE